MIRIPLIAGIVLTLTLGGCAGESSGGERKPPEKDVATAARPPVARTFVIFADVTQSLSSEEHASVANGVQKIIDIMPPKATLLVFPILEDVERAPALYSATFGDVQSTRDSVDFSVAKAQRKKEVAEKLKTVVNGPVFGRKRTCISGAFRKAEEFTIDATPERPMEIVIISDMLEDCDDSLLGRRLSLEKRLIREDLAAAHDLPDQPLLKLNGASVTVLLSTQPTAQAVTDRPAAHQLQMFWREILDRSGDNRTNFRFGTEVPQRLKDLNVEAGRGL